LAHPPDFCYEEPSAWRFSLDPFHIIMGPPISFCEICKQFN